MRNILMLIAGQHCATQGLHARPILSGELFKVYFHDGTVIH